MTLGEAVRMPHFSSVSNEGYRKDGAVICGKPDLCDLHAITSGLHCKGRKRVQCFRVKLGVMLRFLCLPHFTHWFLLLQE